MLTQLMFVIFIPAVSLLWGEITAYSVLVGAGIYFIPNLYFVYRTFQYGGARSAKKILRAFYVGESIKILLTGILFGLAFALVTPINILAVFVGFILLQLTNWLVPWLTSRKFG